MSFKVDSNSHRYTDPNVEIKGHVRFGKPISLSNGKKLVALVESRNSSIFGVIKDVLYTLGLIKYDIGYIVKDDEGREKYVKDLAKEDYAHLGISNLKQGVKSVAEFLHNLTAPPVLSTVKKTYLETLDFKNLEDSLALFEEKAGKTNLEEFHNHLKKYRLVQTEINDLATLLQEIADKDPKEIEEGRQSENDPSISIMYNKLNHSYKISLGLERSVTLKLRSKSEE